MNEEIMKAVLETEVDEEAKLVESIDKAGLSDKAVNALKAALRILNAFKEELPTDALDKLASAAGYPKPGNGYPSPQEKQKEKEEPKPCAKSKELPKEVQDAMTTQNDALDALRKQNEIIEKQLKTERDLREEAEWTQKAKTSLSHFPGKSSEELGKILKSLSDVSPEVAKQQFEAMKSASDLIATSSAVHEAGLAAKGESTPSSAMVEIVKMADALVEKSSDVNLTRERAIRRVIDSPRGKELYNKYLAENPAQVSAFAPRA